VLFGISVTVACAIWLLLDLGDLVAPVDWRAHSDGGVSTRGADARVRVLRRQLSDGLTLDGRSLHRSLVSLIDDALRTVHGIDPAADPQLAELVMGPELAAFVRNASPSDLESDPTRLAALIARIERLCVDPTSQETR
jgi:hypothetical protein